MAQNFSLQGYWNNTYINDAGENLETCLNKYGMETLMDEMVDGRVITRQLIYLDARKTDTCSWLFNYFLDGVRATVRMHEENPNTEMKRLIFGDD